MLFFRAFLLMTARDFLIRTRIIPSSVSSLAANLFIIFLIFVLIGAPEEGRGFVIAEHEAFRDEAGERAMGVLTGTLNALCDLAQGERSGPIEDGHDELFDLPADCARPVVMETVSPSRFEDEGRHFLPCAGVDDGVRNSV